MKWISLTLLLFLCGCIRVTTTVDSKYERGSLIKTAKTGNYKDQFTDYVIKIIDPVTVNVYRSNIKSEVCNNSFEKIKVSNVKDQTIHPIEGVAVTAFGALFSPFILLEMLSSHDYMKVYNGFIDSYVSDVYGTAAKRRELVSGDFIVEEELQLAEKSNEPAEGYVAVTINDNLVSAIALDRNGRVAVDLTTWQELKKYNKDLTIKYSYKNSEVSSVVPKSMVQRQFKSKQL